MSHACLIFALGVTCDAVQATSKKSLWDMGLHIFREQLSSRPEVYTKTVQGLLKLIDSERRGDQVGRTV